MPGRSVLQWDESDCEETGMVKIDLLGLGMVAVLQECSEICAQRGQPVDYARIPKEDPAVFQMLSAWPCPRSQCPFPSRRQRDSRRRRRRPWVGAECRQIFWLGRKERRWKEGLRR